MPEYAVTFDPLQHTEEMYVPPDGVSGGIVGDTENGILAVYDVPAEHVQAFESSIAECETVLNIEDLDRGHSR